MRHVFIVNFKTYPESTGPNAVKLARICEKVAVETGKDIRIAVNAIDIEKVSETVKIPVYAEHVDPYPPGRHTGSVLPEIVRTVGGQGTLLNHSEHQISFKELEESIKRASRASLVTVVCADTLAAAEKIVELKPDFIALELPELIGGDVSVSSANPRLIEHAVSQISRKHGIKLLVGAGIKRRADVVKAFELGASGILVSSGVTLAKDPEQALLELTLH